MSNYADPQRVRERSGVEPSDLDLEDRDGDGTVDEADLDALIAELNGLASETVAGYCMRDFGHHTGYTETLDGNDRQSIRLRGYPVISVTSVQVGDGTLDSADYRVKKDSPAWAGENAGILERKGAVFPSGWDNVEVTYDWGYKSPPGAVVSVAEDLVVDALRAAVANKKGAKSGVQSYSMDGFSVSFSESLQSTTGKLTPEQKAQLDDYRRVIIA